MRLIAMGLGALLVGLSTVPAAVAQTVYRCQDGDTTVLSDRPCGEDAEETRYGKTDEPDPEPEYSQGGKVATNISSTDPCRRNVNCWGDEHLLRATSRCQPLVESMAKYDYEWTDGMLGIKFGEYAWKDPEAGVVTYAGNSIKMQNGFGAWQVHRYACDFDTINEQVVDVRVRPGR